MRWIRISKRLVSGLGPRGTLSVHSTFPLNFFNRITYGLSGARESRTEMVDRSGIAIITQQSLHTLRGVIRNSRARYADGHIIHI